MAGEIQVAHDATGKTLYALVRNSTGSVWRTTTLAFVTYATANLADYDVALTEQGTASRYYAGTFPTDINTAGVYSVAVYEQAGGSPAEGDRLVAEGDIHWNGTAVVPVGTLNTGAVTSSVIATDAITSTGLAASAVSEIQSGLATAADLATVDTVVDAIKAVTDNLPDSGALTVITSDLTAIKGAGFSGATDSLEAIRDRGDAAWTTGAGGDATAANQTTIINHLTDIKGGTWSSSTDSLEAIRDRGDAAWITGSGGDATAANQTTIINHLTDIKGATWSSSTDTLEAIRDRGDAAWVTGTSDATAANQTTIINHLTDIKGGTFSGATDSLEAIRDRGDTAWITATGFSTLDAAGVRSAVGLASANLDTQLATIAGYIDTEIATTLAGLTAIEADTQDIQARLPAALVGGRIDASVGAMQADTVTAAALAADAVSEIQSGLATAADLATVDTVVDAVQAVTDKLDTALELDVAVYRFTANALEEAPTGGGGDATAANQTLILAALADVETDTQDIQARLPAALVDGRMDSSAGEIRSNVITAAAMAASAVSEIQSGLATATALAAVAVNVAAVLADTGTDGVVLSAATLAAAADALLARADGVETGFTLQQALRLILASAAAQLSGAATETVVIRDINDTKDRITATVDEAGNRLAVVVDPD